MAMNFGFAFIALMSGLLGGTGNHLLDYASTEHYWKSKEVAVSIETMTKELRPVTAEDVGQVIERLGSPDAAQREEAKAQILSRGPGALPQLQQAAKSDDPAVAAAARSLVSEISIRMKGAAVRRLMAIRALGEMKKPEALAILKPLLDSKAQFEAEYAVRAIARIEGKACPVAPPALDVRKSDVWLLPAECRLVAQQVVCPDDTATIDTMMASFALMLAAAQPNFKPQEVLAEITKEVVRIAEQIGDVRLDGATLGLSGDIGPHTGFAVIIVRGQYDRAAVAAVLRKQGIKTTAVGGIEFFTPDREVAIAFPADDRCVFIAGPAADKLPLATMAAAVAANKGTLSTSPEMVKLLDGVDLAQPMWAVAKMTDDYRQAPVLAAFDTITMGSQRKDKLTHILIAGQGSDAEKVKAAVAQVNDGLKQMMPMLEMMVQQMPAMKPLADAVRGIQCTADGAAAKLTATFPGDASLLMAVPALFYSRASAVPPPEPVRAQ